MSLLNQVLQDLEKRNETNISELHGLRNIQATPVRQSKSHLYIIGIISLLLLVFAIMYKIKETKHVEIFTTPVIKEITLDTSPTIKTFSNKQLAENSLTSSQKKPDTTEKISALQKQDKPEKLITSNITKPITDKAPIKPAEKNPTSSVIVKKSIKTAPKKVKQLSNKQLATQLFTSAQELTNLIEKQLKLEHALKLDMHHIDARLLLAKTLLQQGQTEKASTLLNQGTILFPQNIQLINLRSQLFLQNKQVRPALTLLQQVDDRYIQDETYLALLAAAYQQNNSPLKSLLVYQKLLSINPSKAEYWLGLAMAYEKQKNKPQALNAYQQALNKNSLKTAIVSYIKQRISLLK